MQISHSGAPTLTPVYPVILPFVSTVTLIVTFGFMAIKKAGQSYLKMYCIKARWEARLKIIILIIYIIDNNIYSSLAASSQAENKVSLFDSSQSLTRPWQSGSECRYAGPHCQ